MGHADAGLTYSRHYKSVGCDGVRLIDRIAGDPRLLGALRAAQARAWAWAWELGARPARIVIDVDATLIGAHTEKEGAGSSTITPLRVGQNHPLA